MRISCTDIIFERLRPTCCRYRLLSNVSISKISSPQWAINISSGLFAFRAGPLGTRWFSGLTCSGKSFTQCQILQNIKKKHNKAMKSFKYEMHKSQIPFSFLSLFLCWLSTTCLTIHSVIITVIIRFIIVIIIIIIIITIFTVFIFWRKINLIIFLTKIFILTI